MVVSRLDNRSGSWVGISQLQPGQLRRGVHPQLVAQKLSGALEGAQRLGLAAVPVQGHHELGLESLPQRILRRQSHQLPGYYLVAPQGQVGVDPRLNRREAQLLETADLEMQSSTPIRSA